MSRCDKQLVFHCIYCSGLEFVGNTPGLAIPDSICTDRAIAVISARDLINNVHRLATVISQMIGHNIGLQHDTHGKFTLTRTCRCMCRLRDSLTKIHCFLCMRPRDQVLCMQST